MNLLTFSGGMLYLQVLKVEGGGGNIKQGYMVQVTVNPY